LQALVEKPESLAAKYEFICDSLLDLLEHLEQVFVYLVAAVLQFFKGSQV